MYVCWRGGVCRVRCAQEDSDILPRVCPAWHSRLGVCVAFARSLCQIPHLLRSVGGWGGGGSESVVISHFAVS